MEQYLIDKPNVIENKIESRTIVIRINDVLRISVGACRANNGEWSSPTIYIEDGNSSIPITQWHLIHLAVTKAVNEYSRLYG
jgi:hypothetical protein